MYSIKNNIIYLNLQNGGGNMYDPSGNVNDPSGNVNDPSGNMYDVSIYRNKYIKYKLKYIKLKQQLGGNTLDDDIATYELLEKTEELEKLRIIKYSSDIGKIASLLDYYDSTIVDHARVKLIELQEGVAPQVVAPPAYNPPRNIRDIRPPEKMQPSQSIFYMPLISEAYYLARGLQVPQIILNEGGRIINLGGDISLESYNGMVNALSNFLLLNDNINLLTQDYVNDIRPTDISTGHIKDDRQEYWLSVVKYNEMSLQLILEFAIGVYYQHEYP